MKIFLSWSGKLSKETAELLKKYLPPLLDVNTFMSSHDIESGERWTQKLAFELEQSNFGLVCFTSTNLTAPWLLYEAGAISKLGSSSVCGLLLDNLNTTDITGPLAQFQHIRFIEGDFLKLINEINLRIEKPKDKDQLRLLFDALWPKIHEEYSVMLKRNESGASPHRERTDRELLEELLIKVRKIESSTLYNIPLPNTSLENLLDMPINAVTLTTYSNLKYPGLPISSSWQEQLLTDLNSNKYQYIRDIDNVVNQAKHAVDKFKEERCHLFRYSTDYLTKSLGFVDVEFREIHPWGISTLQAFNSYENLVNKLLQA